MQTPEQLQAIITKAFAEAELPVSPHELYDPVHYTMALGGKRLRPLLVLAACDMFGGRLEEAVNPAIGIELFHNFTLLHDDLMDQAPLRRGKETVYRKWNANIAILAGDTMFALANTFILKTRPEVIPQLMELFSRTAIEVCEGQQYDMNFETAAEVSIAEYMEMIRLKTAVLLAASLKTGALIAGAGEQHANSIYNFGINLGLAFQLKDDLLDVYGDESVFGKVQGGDIAASKKTFLYLTALNSAGENAAGLKKLYCSSDLPAAEKVKRVTAVFDQLNIRSATLAKIDRYYRKALADLEMPGLPAASTGVLAGFAAQLAAREK